MGKTAKDYAALFQKARYFDSTRFTEYTENLAFYEGKQSMLSKYSGAKPWVVDINSPYATDAINTRVASLMANDYIGALEPLSPDDEDLIRSLNDAYVNQWHELNMDNIINESILKCAINREAYVHFIYRPNDIKGGTNRLRKGKLEAYFLDPESVLIDPNARDFKDADYIIIIGRISPKMAKIKYGYVSENGYGKGASMYTPQDRGEISIDGNYTNEQDDILTKLTFYEKVKGGINLTTLVENKIVGETKKIPISCYPIAQLRWEKRQKSPYGISLMDRVLPLQKSVNAIESAITNTALSFASPSLILRRDSGLNPNMVAAVAGAPGVVFSVNGDINNALKPLVNPSIDGNMVAIKRENEETIYKMSGVTDQFKGSLGTAGNTAGGANAALTSAKVIEHTFLENLEAYVEDATRILVEFITKSFKGQTLYTRSERKANGSFDFGSITIPNKDLSDLEYTFYVELDVKTPYSREKSKEILKEMYVMERQYDAPVKTLNIQDIINTCDVPNKQELMLRYERQVAKSDSDKAQVITQWNEATLSAGVDPQVITQGIIEILGGKETPTVDATIQQIQQAQQAEQQQAEQQQAQAEQEQAKLDNTPQDGEAEMGQLLAQVKQMLQSGTTVSQVSQALEQQGMDTNTIAEVIREASNGSEAVQQ